MKANKQYSRRFVRYTNVNSLQLKLLLENVWIQKFNKCDGFCGMRQFFNIDHVLRRETTSTFHGRFKIDSPREKQKTANECQVLNTN